MYANSIKDLEVLGEIVSKFTERCDWYNYLEKIGNFPALFEYKAKIDLIELEKRTRDFVNNSGNIQGKEALKYKNCSVTLPLIMLPEPDQFVKNLKELEGIISSVIPAVNNYENFVREGKYPTIPGFHNDFMQLAKIADGLSVEADLKFVDKKELPDTSLEVQSTSRVGILSWLGLSS
jgi:hypothetical protein